jgi:hypothetical protein
MNETPGQLYIINEQDVRTGDCSRNYKIGIVRDAENRDSKDRLLEHQTGNPRRLYVVETLKTPAVEHIETTLHHLFASNRVLGEWLELNETQLQAVIAKARELKEEMEANLSDFRKAEELKNVISSGSKIIPTHESQYWHDELLTFREVIKTCNEALGKYDSYLYIAIEKGVVAPGVAKIQQRTAPKKFDQKLFESKYPDLFEKYSDIKTQVKGQFRITTPKDWACDISALSSEQVELMSEFMDMLECADHSLDTGFALHEKHLAVLETLQYAEWREEMANVKLRVLTNISDGIEGICSWKRESENSRVLDKKSLQDDYPSEYNDCVIEGKATQALIVNPKMAGVSNEN